MTEIFKEKLSNKEIGGWDNELQINVAVRYTKKTRNKVKNGGDMF